MPTFLLYWSADIVVCGAISALKNGQMSSIYSAQVFFRQVFFIFLEKLIPLQFVDPFHWKYSIDMLLDIRYFQFASQTTLKRMPCMCLVAFGENAAIQVPS